MEVLHFLQSFFGPGNNLRWEKIATRKLHEEAIAFLTPWLEDLKSRRRPVVLPRVHADDRLEWYALAFSVSQARALREDLLAFIGPTYTNFTGQMGVLDLNDPVDAAVYGLVENRVYRFIVGGLTDKDRVRESLGLMRTLWDQRPIRVVRVARPTGRILRDFEMALRVGKDEMAGDCLMELKAGGHLSAQNLAFLKVRRLAAVAAWSDLLEIPELQDLLALRRPALVTQSIIQAVYVQELAAFETMGEPGRAVAHFREEVLRKYPSLFSARGPMRAPEVMKTFMMLSAVAEPPRPELAGTLLAEYPPDCEDRPYLEALSKLVPVSELGPPESPWERALRLYWARDYDSALNLLIEFPSTHEALRLALVCAHELNTLEAAQVALKVYQNASRQDQEVVLAARLHRTIWENLQQLFTPACPTKSETIPNDWISWFQSLDELGNWPAAVSIAERGILEWDLSSYLKDIKSVNRLAHLLTQGRSEEAKSNLRLTLPYIIGFFLPEGRPERFFKPIYRSCLEFLTLDDQLSSVDLEAVSELVAAILEAGISEPEYVDLMEWVELVWDKVAAPKNLDWALDILDLFVTFPASSTRARERLFSRILGSISSWARRLRPEQWELFRLLCEDLEQGEAYGVLKRAWVQAETQPFSNILQRQLAGRNIAVYTLMESAGRRLKSTLEQNYPGIKVNLSNDHVGNDRLRALARDADIFLIATRCAKHSATQFIENHRAPSGLTLYAPGKGSTGLLRILYHHLAKESYEARGIQE